MVSAQLILNAINSDCRVFVDGVLFNDLYMVLDDLGDLKDPLSRVFGVFSENQTKAIGNDLLGGNPPNELTKLRKNTKTMGYKGRTIAFLGGLYREGPLEDRQEKRSRAPIGAL